MRDILNDIISRFYKITKILEYQILMFYAKTLNQYCNFTNKNPTELIEQAELDEDQQIRMKTQKIKKYNS